MIPDERDVTVSDVYEGLTAAQYEDFEPEYDAGDLEEEADDPTPIRPLTGFDLYIMDKYAGAGNQVKVDEDTGYGTNSYFARAMIRE